MGAADAQATVVPTKAATATLLACKCGDCTHWEIIKIGTPMIGSVQLKCKTCGQTYGGMLAVDPHDQLTTVEREA